MTRTAAADHPPTRELLDRRLGRWHADTPTSADELTRWQLERAWATVERHATANPFYADRLSLPAGRTAADFRALPVTVKADVVADCAEHPPFGRRSTCAPERLRQVVETSGTSGQGREVYVLDAADVAAVHQTEAVGFRWAGVGSGTRVLLTLPVTLSAAGTWYRGGLELLGATVLAVGSLGTARKVEALWRYGAEVVVGTPSYVHRLAHACRDAGHDPAELGVRALIVAGEGYSPQWGRELQATWGATLYEQYGCTQRAIAWTCPDGVLPADGERVLHFPPESGYMEVLSADGRPVDDGEYGELVVTPFGADCSPLIRFATGDRVRWAAAGACPCGRPLAGIRPGSVHRSDDMVKVRGTNLWPEALDAAVLGVAGVEEYRARVVTGSAGDERLHVTVESANDAGALVPELVRTVRERTGLRPDVEVVASGTITASIPDGFVKLRRLVDERLPGRAARQPSTDRT